MKHIIAIIILCICFTSCDTLDELTKFNISYDEQVSIPTASPIDLPFNISTPKINTNSDSKFNSNDTAKNLVEEIQLTEFKLTLTKPDTEDLSFLETIEVYIAADDLPDTKIAWNATPIQNLSNELQLETSNEDLKAYIFKEDFYLKFKFSTDELLTQEHDININTTFFVDAKILGI
ncbi:hypothetical protein [Formosa sp. S-31]|uniref:hypothetical protein n=1 Tax=Formosa sp. S-31 TaxID=2790949 RepID=UPI003EB9C321